MIARLLYPAVTLAVVLAVWHFGCIWFNVPSFVLPGPLEVWSALVESVVTGVLWPHLWYTTKATLLGFGISVVIGVGLGALLAESVMFERFLSPFLVALQAMPKVALAPLLLVWFGFGIESKIVMVILICFFPLFVNTLVGIRQTDPDLIEMARVFSASRLYIFWHVKLPAAAGTIFAGFQIGASLALIGAIVAEFVSSQRGLGHWIGSATVSMAVSTMFAGIIVLSVMGIVASEVIRIVHRRVAFWENRSTITELKETVSAS
jgi:NitT/TauT family transport system permease protein